MANTATNTNNLSLRSILEKDKLTGANFLEWERNLMIVLSTRESVIGTGTKTKDVLMVRDGRAKRKLGHGNTSKGKSQPQATQSVTKVENNDKRKGKGKKVKPNKARTENRCFKCHKIGHWRENCPKHREAGINASGGQM
ncbi:hypothetical protein OSB04_un001825 [Centaurea solstitialis]|uniref:CCHC-type domain-containing protein n=1 Tax=Centaurea solstitialis TaxID=347529 RepID=A0AA38SA52_9ASTR|nr:hypothetical protein OSB04_un001825 [Centaurea solstitialis]